MLGFSRQIVLLFAFACVCRFASSAEDSEAVISHPLDAYNVAWDTPSKDSSESMPCGGGDIGLNVWVEQGDILFYIQRSGSLAENNEYLKLGRVRLQLDPNPFDADLDEFQQELNLHAGHVTLVGKANLDSGERLEATVRVWVEVHRPIIHVEVDGNQQVDATVCYENWRLTDELIPNNNRRRSFFTLNNYPGEVKLGKDQVAHTAEGVLFYHRNPGDNTLPQLLIKQQGLTEYDDDIVDDLRHRTFGGLMTGPGFADAGVSTGKYQTAPFQAWKLRSQEPSRSHRLRIVTHIDQSETLDTWMQTLQDRADASANDLEEARKKSLVWWAEFWDRSWIIVKPDETNTIDRAWRTGRNYNLFRYQLGCNVHGEYPSKFNGGNFPKNMVQSWHQDGIFYARMGMTEAAAKYTTSKLHDSPRRFPTFWGPGHDWVPDHNWGGSGMIALQEMLMQTIGNEIRLLPAWPRDWDVKFKLHAPQRTTVECEYRDGEIVELKVTPSQRRKDVIITEEMD